MPLSLYMQKIYSPFNTITPGAMLYQLFSWKGIQELETGELQKSLPLI